MVGVLEDALGGGVSLQYRERWGLGVVIPFGRLVEGLGGE